MTNDEWSGILSAALTESGLAYTIFSSDCSQNSTVCFATMQHEGDGRLVEVKVMRSVGSTADSMKGEVIAQLQADQGSRG